MFAALKQELFNFLVASFVSIEGWADEPWRGELLANAVMERLDERAFRDAVEAADHFDEPHQRTLSPLGQLVRAKVLELYVKHRPGPPARKEEKGHIFATVLAGAIPGNAEWFELVRGQARQAVPTVL